MGGEWSYRLAKPEKDCQVTGLTCCYPEQLLLCRGAVKVDRSTLWSSYRPCELRRRTSRPGADAAQLDATQVKLISGPGRWQWHTMDDPNFL
jgi:hypothetical protein